MTGPAGAGRKRVLMMKVMHGGARRVGNGRPARAISLLLLAGLLASMPASAARKNGFELDGALVPQDDILKGGPPRDGIPALDRPRFLAAAEADFMAPTDRVLGVQVADRARAYPIRILNYHEIVNDVLGGQPLVVTYCPLCGSGMAFAAEVGKRSLNFGVSGLLYNSDVLLYDRQTESLWSQLKRQAVSGSMRGEMLEALPVTHTTWRDWLERHPRSDVLSNDTGYARNYNVNPYPGYSKTGRIYFPVAEEDSRYPRKTIVSGLEVDGHFKAYPFPELARGPSRFADRFQGLDIEVVFDEANETATIYGPEGEELPTVQAFWFAWYAFHPDTAVYAAEDG